MCSTGAVHRLALAAVLCCPIIAHADVTRCAEVRGDVSYMVSDLPEAHADTGWFPNGSVAQLRITGKMAGETTVAMGLSPTACWDNGMAIAVPGVAQTGWLDSEYGAALDVYGQIHTSVLGYQIDWNGKIPLPTFLPHDFLLAGQTKFDPTVLSGSVSVTSDPTSPVIVVSTDVLSELITLGGISGGLDITVQGVMTTDYTTSKISIGGGAVTHDGDRVTVARPEHGFGPTVDTKLAAAGVVHYEPSVIFAVVFDVRIFGIRVVNFSLASVTLPLPKIDRQVTLDAGMVHIPLPHLDRVPTSLGFASGATQQLRLHNAGAAPLQLEIASAPAGVTAPAITIAPGADGTLDVTAADPSALGGATLELATNDPNYPSLQVALDPSGDGETTSPSGSDPESSGCSTSGAGAPVWLVLALAALRRRRR
jgi:uncharacterized protein (TIGR03382 family)